MATSLPTPSKPSHPLFSFPLTLSRHLGPALLLDRGAFQMECSSLSPLPSCHLRLLLLPWSLHLPGNAALAGNWWMGSWPWGWGSIPGAKPWESARCCWMKVPSVMVSPSPGWVPGAGQSWGAGTGGYCWWALQQGASYPRGLNFLSSPTPGPLPPSETRLGLPGSRYPILPFPRAGAGACRPPRAGGGVR